MAIAAFEDIKPSMKTKIPSFDDIPASKIPSFDDIAPTTPQLAPEPPQAVTPTITPTPDLASPQTTLPAPQKPILPGPQLPSGTPRDVRPEVQRVRPIRKPFRPDIALEAFKQTVPHIPAIARGVENVIGNIGSLVQWASDISPLANTIRAIKAKLSLRKLQDKNIPIAKKMEIAKDFNKDKNWLSEKAVKWSDWWSEQANKGWEAPSEEIMNAKWSERPIAKGASVIGEAAPNFAAAIAASILTRNPKVGLTFISLMSGGGAYKRQREKGAGVNKANAIATLTAAWEYVTEKVPFEAVFKPAKSLFLKMLKIGTLESAQEFVQGIGENFLEYFGYTAKDMASVPAAVKEGLSHAMDGWVENVVAGAGLGVLGGTVGISRPTIPVIPKTDITPPEGLAGIAEQVPEVTPSPIEEAVTPKVAPKPAKPVAAKQEGVPSQAEFFKTNKGPLAFVDHQALVRNSVQSGIIPYEGWESDYKDLADAFEQHRAIQEIRGRPVPELQSPKPLEAKQEAVGKVETAAVKVKKDTERKRVVSRFKGKVTDRDSLEDIGNQMADHLGIERPVFWRFGRSPKEFGVYGETRTFKGGEIGIVVNQGGKSLVIKNQAEVDYMWDNSGIRVKIGQKVFPSQGLVKSVILHELLHIKQGSLEELGIDVATVKDDVELQKLVHTEGFKKGIQETRKELFVAQPTPTEPEAVKGAVKEAEQRFLALTKAPTPVKERLKVSTLQVLRQQKKVGILSEAEYVAKLNEIAAAKQPAAEPLAPEPLIETKPLAEKGKIVKGKEIFTSVPAEWKKEETLVDWGKKGIRTQGNRALKIDGKTRKTFVWKEDLTELPTRLPPSTIKAFKDRTEDVWKLQRRGKGEDVWLVPKELKKQLEAELGPEAFKRRPVPERSPKQKLNDTMNSMRIRELSPAVQGEIILDKIKELGIAENTLNDTQKKFIKEFRDEQRRKGIPTDVRPRVEQEVQVDQIAEAERKAIQEEQIAGEIGEQLDKVLEQDFLEGITEEKPARQKDLLGRVELKGGVTGKQREMFDKEDFKTLKERERIVGKEDIKGQKKLFEKPPKKTGLAAIAEEVPKKAAEKVAEPVAKKKPTGAAGGASVAAAGIQEGSGYGTIEASEKSKMAETTQPHRVQQAMPDKASIGILDELLKIASPAHRGGGAREGARVIRKNLGKLSQETVVAHEALKKAHHAFTFMNRKDIYDFIDRMETGRQQMSPRLTQISDKFREMLDGRRDAVQNLGKGHLESFYENYFPHIWKDPKVAGKTIAQIFGKRTLQGSKSFLKKRTIVTIKDGREAGLELVSENPVDLVLLKMFEMDRYLMAHHIIQDMKSRGLIKFVYARSKSPEGYKKVDDRAFTVYMPPEITKKEAYDSLLVDQLLDIAKSIGIDTDRFVSLGKGRGRWFGYAEKDQRKVRTRFAGPESVLAHEIGHILGYDYNLYETIRRAREGSYKTITRGEKQGQERFVPTEAAVEHRKTIDKEWRALADARIKGTETTEGFKKYVRKAREKEAVMLEALIHAPNEFKRVAPKLFKLFKNFLNEHSELRPLLDTKPSLVLGTSEAKIPVPGFTVLGHYYAPEPVAKILNNYLSPGLRNSENRIIASGYNMARGAANILNQAQLALSGFHALNVTTDMMASTFGQGIRRLGISGQRTRGVADIVSTPISPALRLWSGVRLRRAYKKQIDEIEDENLRSMVKAVTLADGRDRMDPFYYNHQIKALKNTIGELIHGSPKQKIKGVFRLPFNTFGSVLELAAKPLMEWYVPTGKLGLFSMMAKSEMQRAEKGQITAEQLHERLVVSWDSVDNRMGQLVYDNLFWNKTLKDVAMLAVRSVGWNLGSWREYAGVPVDILGTKGRLDRGDVLLSQKMAYTVGAVTLYATLGAIIMYLLTGEGPEELKDYFFPKTGNKNADGSDERLSLPTYAKDWFAYGTQPVKTVTHKIHPLWGLLGDLAANKDFFNTLIRQPGDPIGQQLFSMAKHIGKEFLPLSVRNYKKMQKATPDKGTKNLWVSISGITSAPSYIVRTRAQKLMYRYIIENIPKKTKTSAQQELYGYRKNIKNRLRKGDPVPQSEVIAKIGRASFSRLIRDASKEPFTEAFGRLSLTQALNVYAIANTTEQKQTLTTLSGKYSRAKKITPDMEVLYRELTGRASSTGQVSRKILGKKYQSKTTGKKLGKK